MHGCSGFVSFEGEFSVTALFEMQEFWFLWGLNFSLPQPVSVQEFLLNPAGTELFWDGILCSKTVPNFF
jgi:hypothetical protein